MRIRVTGFAVSQNLGLMIASFFPSIFTAVAPPGSANIPVTIGLTTFGICAVAALATLLSPETRGKSLDDLEVRKAGPDAATSSQAQKSAQANETLVKANAAS